MNEKIKKTFRAMTSAALAGAFVVSSVIGGGADSFVNSSVVFAEDTSQLADGSYIVPLIPINWNNESVSTSKAVPYSSRCLLDVENGSYTITIKMNSDFYAGWILDNAQNSSYTTVKSIWAALGADEEAELNTLVQENGVSYTKNRYTFSEENNEVFNSAEITKQNQEDTCCYVTFELSDYSEKFYSIFWSENKISGNKNDNVQALKLDIDSAYTVSELHNKISSGKAGISIDEARKVTTTNGNALNENQELKALFQNSADTAEHEGIVTANFGLKDTQLGGSEVTAVNAFTSKTYVEKSTYNNSLPYNATYGKQLLNANSLGVQAEYTEDDLIYGLEITVETEETKTNRESATNLESRTIGSYNGYFGTLYLTPDDITDVSIEDSNQTGVYVTGTSDILPETAVLTVVKDKSYTEYPETSVYTRDGIIEWQGTMYNDPKHWFYIELTDENGNDLSSYDGITLHIPLETVSQDNDPTEYAIFAYHVNDGLFFSTDNYGNEQYGSVKQVTDSTGNTSYEFQYVNSLGEINIQKATFAYMQPGDYADIHGMVKSGDDDGIYKGTAQLQKYGTRGSSMANAALNPDVMVTICNGEAKLYYTADYLTVLTQQAYIGELLPYDVNHAGVWFDDGSVYTNFLTDETGALVSNCGYDPITEAGCVKGGIITLREETYDISKGCYNLAIVPPAMLGGVDYETIDKTELTVHLRVTDFQKVADYSEQNVLEYVKAKYPYDKSALLRKIRQAEIKYNIGKNTASDSTAFANAYAVYNKENATSQEIEAAINALDEVTTDTIPTATATVKGYSLTAKEDFGLHLFVDLGYDAQNDANAAVKFNIGGTEKTIAVSDATFVEGKGYEFVLDVPAKKMYDEITAEIVLSDGAEVIGDANLGTYSVAGYLNDYIASDDNTLDALAQATLTYGAYADKFFNGSTDAELADVSAVTIDDVAQYKHNINVTEEGIDFVGAALTLESKTSVKLYFKVDEDNLYDIADFAFTVNGNKAEPERNGDYYYITVPKLTAGELAKAQTFTVNDAEFSYSPFSYVYAALADSDAEKEDDLTNLVKALYLYGAEAGKVA